MSKIELQSNSDAFESLARDMATMYMNRSTDFVQSVGNDFINTVAFAMHLRPDEEKIKEGNSSDSVFFSNEVIDGIQPVINAIKSYGGNDPYMIIYPAVLKIENSDHLFDDIVSLPIFQVRNKNDASESKYVDIIGRTYSDAKDFTSNVQFPKCEMWYPTNLIFTKDRNEKAQISYTTITPSNMHIVDLVIGILCLGAGFGTLATGFGAPVSAAIFGSCSVYAGIRGVQTIVDRSRHGQTLNPFADWDSFGAWTSIVVNAITLGVAGSAVWLSSSIIKMAEEGLKIAETTKYALRASIYIPLAINGGLMGIQFYQLVKYWNQIPVEHKIIIGLQFIFFAAASYKMGTISISKIEQRVTDISYNELSKQLVRLAEGSSHATKLRSGLETATNRVGGVSIRAIDFFKKLVNYNRGELITTGVNENNKNYITLTEEGDEIGFQIRQKYFACAEATMDIHDGVIRESDQPSTSGSLDANFRLPENDGSRLDAASRLAEVKRFVPKESVEAAKEFMKNLLGVSELEDYQVNGVNIFKNMKYHDQMRVRVFEDIGKSLNDGLTKACIRFANEGNAKTVGQYASDYEIASLQIHKEANELVQSFEDRTPQEIRNMYEIAVQITTEKRLTFEDLAKEKGNTLFADELNAKKLAGYEAKSVSNIGTDNAAEIYNSWKAQSERSFVRKTVGNPEASVHTLANEIINAGDISYPNSSNQAINAANLLGQYPDSEINNLATNMANDANFTIQSCRGNVESRVFEVTRQREKLPIRRLIFWNLDDQNFAKSTQVTVNKQTGEVSIQNFQFKKITTTTTQNRNPKTAIFDHWNNNFNYDAFKTRLTTMVNIIQEECQEYVGHAVIRAGLDHDNTVNDIQSLRSVRFASIEQAICHVLKHGENLTSEDLVAAVKNYFDKSQEIIQYSKSHPENVSSSWTQTGSARDFIFYRKLEGQTGVERVVVLVREGGEVILKTYFKDSKLFSVPRQQKHQYRESIDIKHANLHTFYFQLMLLAPRYGVLLPKDYEIFNTVMDAKKTRIIIQMAGRCFGDGDNPNTLKLSKSLTEGFPLPAYCSWNIAAVKVGEYYSFTVNNVGDNYLYCRVKNFRFLIHARRMSYDTTVQILRDASKYRKYSKRGTVIKNVGFENDVLDITNQICTYYSKSEDIAKALSEVFGGCWDCIRLSGHNYVLNFLGANLSLDMNEHGITCHIFRC